MTAKRDEAREAFDALQNKAVKKSKGLEIDIISLTRGVAEVAILGVSPLFCNSMSHKAATTLLQPSRKRNRAERDATPKHSPIDEFRDSIYRSVGDKAPTRILMPAGAFKKAMASAALDLPGATKAEMGRWTWVEGMEAPDMVSIYGTPMIDLRIVRSADIARTPDVRTRAILPRWGCRVRISYMRPMLTATAVSNLMAAAGFIRGVGDFRQEKGAGSFGQFELVAPTDPRFLELLPQGREVQDRALEDPSPYNAESATLLQWHATEMAKRFRDEEQAETDEEESRDDA